MKKFLTIGMVLLMTFAMIGCGKSESAEIQEEPTENVEVEESEKASENPLVGKSFEIVKTESNGEEVIGSPAIWTFNEDGTMVQQSEDITTNGTYTVEGSVAQVEMEGITVPVNIEGDTLTYEFGDTKFTLELKK